MADEDGRSTITVVGSFAVGLTIRAPKLPVFGETMFGRDFDMGPGGKGSNQAVGTARLGASSALCGLLGTDKLAGIATDLYAVEGVDASLLDATDRRATGAGLIILNDKGENFIVLDMGANEEMDPAFVDRAEDRIARSDVVMSVLEIPIAAAQRAMELGRRHGARTILNPAPAAALPDAIFGMVDYLTPNESELRILLGYEADDPRPTRELAHELRRRGVGNVVVTLGRTGALILTGELDIVVPALPVEVVDTTGAGDAFNSGFAVALAEGRDLVDAVRFGVVCGSLACTELGVIPSLPRRERVDAAYAEALQTIWKETS
jgi:ribokinase